MRNRGSQLKAAKLNEDDVSLILSLFRERDKLDNDIKRLYEARKNLTNKAIAEKFEVSKRAIDKISEGLSWRHVK